MPFPRSTYNLILLMHVQKRGGLMKELLAVVVVFLSFAGKSHPLVPDLPKGNEAEMLQLSQKQKS